MRRWPSHSFDLQAFINTLEEKSILSTVLTCDHCSTPIKIGQKYHEVHYNESNGLPPVVYHYHYEGRHIQISDILPEEIGTLTQIVLKEYGSATMKSYDPQYIQTRK